MRIYIYKKKIHMEKLPFILIFLFFIPITKAALNPAYVYCTALGYKFEYKEDYSLCILPNGKEADAWQFLQGKVAQEYSYCKLKGLEIRTEKNPEKCMRFLLDECAFCVFPNGTKIEVTELMGLSFEETKCGDGRCGLPENYHTCPQDCPSGSYDGLCDGVADGICDQDCIDRKILEKDPDCVKIFCGNRVCEKWENEENCCKDCGCSSDFSCIENKCTKVISPIFYLIILLVISALVAIVILLSKRKPSPPYESF
jgi:putative hemolysin